MILIVVVALLLIGSGVALYHFENRETEQSRAYKEWYRRDKTIRQSAQAEWNRGNWS